jgi:hypothetical protein
MDDADTGERRERADSGRESDAVSRARAALADWEPADVNSQKARRATVAVVGWLASEGGARQRAAVLEWADGQDVEGYAPSTLWDKVAQPGLAELERAGVVTRTPNVGYEIVDDTDD